MPSLGPIKRRDLIRDLRKLGLRGPMLAANTNTWLKGKSGWYFPTYTELILVEIFS